MIKSSIILFLTCFFIYLPFSREPDYFDSETTPAVIVAKGDSLFASYNEFGNPYKFPLSKKEYASKLGQGLEVRYELSHPEKACVNKAWGYWFINAGFFWMA